MVPSLQHHQARVGIYPDWLHQVMLKVTTEWMAFSWFPWAIATCRIATDTRCVTKQGSASDCKREWWWLTRSLPIQRESWSSEWKSFGCLIHRWRCHGSYDSVSTSLLYMHSSVLLLKMGSQGQFHLLETWNNRLLTDIKNECRVAVHNRNSATSLGTHIKEIANSNWSKDWLVTR